MTEWIPLPVEFKGIWFSPKYGGFSIYLSDRFNPCYPPDRLRELMIRRGIYRGKIMDRDHVFASPRWMSREEFESKFGKVEKILVYKETWGSDRFNTPKEIDLLIITEKYIVIMDEYDGYEYFRAIPNFKFLNEQVKEVK
jgi:hypothetical protein